MTTAPGADELRMRALLLRRGIGHDAVVIPPPPAHQPTIGAPKPDDWWNQIFDGPGDSAIYDATSDRPEAGGGRLPPPGQVINLDAIHQPPSPAAENAPVKETPAPGPPTGPEPDTSPTEDEDTEPEPGIVERRRVRDDLTTIATDTHTEIVQAGRGILRDARQRRRIAHVTHLGTAAATGWWLGLGPWIHTHLEQTGATNPTDGTTVGLATVALAYLIEWRTHGMRDHDRHLITRLIGWLARIPLGSAALALALYGQGATTL